MGASHPHEDVDLLDVGLVVVGVATNHPSHVSAMLSSCPSFDRFAKAMAALRGQHRYAIANNLSLQPWSRAEATYREECRLARLRYRLADLAQYPGIIGSRIHDAPIEPPSTRGILIVGVTAMCLDELSVLGECGLDPRELRDVAGDLASHIAPASVVAFDVAVSENVHFGPDVRGRWPELVALDQRA